MELLARSREVILGKIRVPRANAQHRRTQFTSWNILTLLHLRVPSHDPPPRLKRRDTPADAGSTPDLGDDATSRASLLPSDVDQRTSDTVQRPPWSDFNAQAQTNKPTANESTTLRRSIDEKEADVSAAVHATAANEASGRSLAIASSNVAEEEVESSSHNNSTAKVSHRHCLKLSQEDSEPSSNIRLPIAFDKACKETTRQSTEICFLLDAGASCGARLDTRVGSHSFWMADGDLANIWQAPHGLKAMIQAEFEGSDDFPDVRCHVYLMGRRRESVKPTIVLWGGREPWMRKRACDLLKDSRAIQTHFRGLMVFAMKYPPDAKRAHLVADFDLGGSSHHRDLEWQSAKALRNHLDPGTYPRALYQGDFKALGKTLLIDHDGYESLRSAVAGGVLSDGRSLYCLTAAHVFIGPFMLPFPHVTDDTDNDVYGLDATDAISEGENDPGILSGPESRPENACRTGMRTSDDAISQILPSSSRNRPDFNVLRQVGDVVLPVADGHGLDYALIEITDRTALLLLRESLPRRRFPVGIASAPYSGNIFIHTENGPPRHGVLFKTSVLALCGTDDVEDVRELWTIRMNIPLNFGDCGAWVICSRTHKLLGHVIEANVNNGFAYLVPAFQVFADVQRSLNRTLTLDLASTVQTCNKLLATPQKGRDERAAEAVELLKLRRGTKVLRRYLGVLVLLVIILIITVVIVAAVLSVRLKVAQNVIGDLISSDGSTFMASQTSFPFLSSRSSTSYSLTDPPSASPSSTPLNSTYTRDTQEVDQDLSETQSARLSNGDIAGVVIGGLTAFLLLSFSLYFILVRRKRGLKTKRVEVRRTEAIPRPKDGQIDPMKDHAAMELQGMDEVRTRELQTPVLPTKGNAAVRP